MSLIDNLNWRHAVKAFKSGEKVSQDNIDKIIEATRLAPTSSGLQPFRLIVVENQAVKEKLVEGALNPDCMKDCSHVFVFAGWDNYTDDKIDHVFDMTTDARDLPRGRFSSYTDQLKDAMNAQTQAQNFAHIGKQAYIALGLAMAQAAELKVDTCPAEGFNPQVIDDVLALDKHGLKSIVILYVGVSDPERDWIAPMAKVRVATDDFVIEVK